jgi:hypothetical protein
MYDACVHTHVLYTVRMVYRRIAAPAYQKGARDLLRQLSLSTPLLVSRVHVAVLQMDDLFELSTHDKVSASSSPQLSLKRLPLCAVSQRCTACAHVAARMHRL